MRLHQNDHGFESQLPTDEYEAGIEFSQKMVTILSDHIYKDKILAVIRELSCNAYDSMVEAGKKDCPFKMHLPTRMDPTFYVEDNGVGLDPLVLPRVYLTYGHSTKTDNDEAIGALGLGSKSPFAYTKSSFIVRNRWNGVEYSYLVYYNAQGKPAMSKVGEEVTDRGNGLRAEFAVKPQDISAFFDRTDRFFKYWKNTLPDFVGQDTKRVLHSKIDKVIDGGSWYLENRGADSDFKGAIAIMGNIQYPIEADSIPNLPEELKVVAQNSFVIEFPLGSLAFQPSREALSFDDFTNKSLIARLEEVRLSMGDTFKAQIFKKGQTQLQFRKNFTFKLNEFARIIRRETISSARYDNQIYWAVKFLLNRTHVDSVTYDKYEYSIDGLLNNVHYVVRDGHQQFAIISETTRGKNARIWLSNATSLTFSAKQDVPYDEIYPGPNIASRKIKQNEKVTFDWIPSLVPNRKNAAEYSNVQRVVMSGKFDVVTNNRLMLDSPEATFVINDEGGPGESKYKAYIKSHHRGPQQYFFVKHITKDISIVELTQKVASFIEDNGMKGASIEFTSNLEDYRPVLDKVKKNRGTIKLYVREFKFYPTIKKPFQLSVGRKTEVGRGDMPRHQDEHTQTIFEWDVLKNAKLPWLYLRKTRSKVEANEDTKANQRSFITHNKDAVILALTKGLLEDVEHEVLQDPHHKTVDNLPVTFNKYTVLVLTDGHIKELQKKGIKMVGLYDHVNAKVAEMFKAHDFRKDLEHDAMMDNQTVINGLYNRMAPATRRGLLTRVEPEVPSAESLMLSMLKNYDDYLNAPKNNTESYEMVALYQYFVDMYSAGVSNSKSARTIDEKVKDRYPILKYMSINNLDKNGVDILLDYASMVENNC